MIELNAKGYFITGIGTEIGKTVVSSQLVNQLKADYWKPIQAGDLDNTDSMKVERGLTNTQSVIHPEGYRLKTPASPHYAAELDGIEIKIEKFKLPQTNNTLIVEGAGGILVPINQQQTMLDLMVHLQLPVICVIRHYLGSINHSLMSVNLLKQTNVPFAGYIINGTRSQHSEAIIEKLTGLKAISFIDEIG